MYLETVKQITDVENEMEQAKAAKYGKVRPKAPEAAKKPTPKQPPRGQKPQGGGKGGKK